MLAVRTQQLGAVAVLCLEGRLVNGETDELSETVRSQSNVSVVVLDFAGVELIDAKGLGVLMELRELNLSRGIELRLINVNSLVQRVLELTRLDSVFRVLLQTDGPGGRAGRESSEIQNLPLVCSEVEARRNREA